MEVCVNSADVVLTTGTTEVGTLSAPADGPAETAAELARDAVDPDVRDLAACVEALARMVAMDQLKGTDEWFRRINREGYRP
jgi:hypothetical protein